MERGGPGNSILAKSGFSVKSAAVRTHSSPCGLLHHPDLSRKGSGGKKKSKNRIKWLCEKEIHCWTRQDCDKIQVKDLPGCIEDSGNNVGFYGVFVPGRRL